MTSDSLSRYEPAEPRAGPPPLSERSRGVALGLAIVGGWCGLHRFYTGRTQSGIWMLLTIGGLGMWYLYDVVVVAAGDFRDGDGRRVVRWDVSEATTAAAAGAGGESGRRLTDVEDRLLGLETQVNELAERLDFTERLLAQARERGAVPKG